jgi:glycosyltransferase involved in cell wall biosynthesis
MRSRPTVGLVLWGDRFEDVFEPLGISLEDFRRRLTGGWFLGYVRGLSLAGVDTLIVLVSTSVDRTTWFDHVPTGARVLVLPTPRRHRRLRPIRNRLRGRRGYKVLGSITSYLSVPVVPCLLALRRAGVDVLLVQDYEHARFDLFVLLGRLSRRPVYATFQGGTTPRSRLERPFRRAAIRACSGLAIGPRLERDRVRAQYVVPEARIAAIPNALDVAEHGNLERASARRALGISLEATVVEWHGRILLHRKGLDTLVAAWQQVCEQRPDRDLLLLLLGTGPDASAFRRLIDDSGVTSVRWRDEFVTEREELAPYLAAADIYVLPSRHEGFPVALVEAMANRLAVVATDAPGVADILGGGDTEAGVMVARDDPAALAEALGRVIDDGEFARQLGGVARDRVVERYSVEAVGRDLAAFLLSGTST